MIPSDHFVRFYNEVFKFLDERNALQDYYDAITEDQKSHCLALFKAKGLQGMYEYWERIRIEENCDMVLTLFDDHFVLEMRKCPSLGKVINNDAGPCQKYCLHCAGWVLPLISASGFYCVYNTIDLMEPRCVSMIFKNYEDAKKYSDDLLAKGGKYPIVQDNFKQMGKE